MAALENELAIILTELAQKLAAELPAREALSAILAGATRIIPCRQATILGYEDGRFVPMASRGQDVPFSGGAGGGTAADVLAPLLQAGARQVQVVCVSSAAPGLGEAPATEDLDWLVAPLVLGQRLVGMLGLAAPPGERYDGATVNLTAPFAVYAALVIDRARLMQDVAAERQRRAAAEQDLARAHAGRGQHLAEAGAAYAANLMAANDELARAARMKDEFLAAMSHELRTPLNTILGMTEVLLDQVFGALNERQERSLRHVAESGKHLLELINDILDVAKIESGQMKLHVDIVDLPALCTGSLELIRPAAERKQVGLVLELDPGVSHLQADGRRVR
jgi:signal transduction histidine kinase